MTNVIVGDINKNCSYTGSEFKMESYLAKLIKYMNM